MNIRHNSRPTPHVLAYYGSFIDDETYNIILEYADRGNLEDFMKTTPRPSTLKDMLVFWERLCSITHGLATIHGHLGNTPEGIPVLRGYVNCILKFRILRPDLQFN